MIFLSFTDDVLVSIRVKYCLVTNPTEKEKISPACSGLKKMGGRVRGPGRQSTSKEPIGRKFRSTR